MRVVAGIYALVNLLNGKVYVGSSLDVFVRTGKHLRWLRNGTHWNPHLQAAYNAGQRFVVRVLEKCPADDSDLGTRLLEREDHWIAHFGSLDKRNGYNMAWAVRKAPSQDGRRRISESRKGKTWEEIYGVEQARNLRDEYRERFSGAGNPMHGVRGAAHPFFGKTTVELFGRETAERMAAATSAAHKGKPKSQSTRAKLSAAHKGTKLSEEHRARIKAGLNRHHKAAGTARVLKNGPGKPAHWVDAMKARRCPVTGRLLSKTQLQARKV